VKPHGQVVVVAPVAGFLLGFLDFVWIKYVPSVVAGLGNSVAIWAVAAFLLTYLLGEGLSNAEIGTRLHLSVTTVKTHVANLMTKTGHTSRVHLAILSVRAGVAGR
jgi:hypothetical protein